MMRKKAIPHWGIEDSAGKAGEVRRVTEIEVDGKMVKVGDKMPLPKQKLDVRPTAPIDNRPSFAPGRNSKR